MSGNASKAVSLKNEGNTLFGQRKFSEALSKYKEAFILDPTQAVFASNAAQCLLHLERYAEAEVMASSALALDGKHAKSFFRRAKARRHQGNETGALSDLKKAKDLDQSDEAINEEMSKLRIAKEEKTIETEKTYLESPIVHTWEDPFPHIIENNSFADFEVAWKQVSKSKEDLIRYLSQYDPKRFSSLFKDLMTTEIAFSFFQTAEALAANPETAKQAYDILLGISSLDRFPLMYCFFDIDSKAIIPRIFALLEKNQVSCDDIKGAYL